MNIKKVKELEQEIIRLVKEGNRVEARKLALSIANPHQQDIKTRKYYARRLSISREVFFMLCED